jgi:hypothetical protein
VACGLAGLVSPWLAVADWQRLLAW